MNKDIDRVVNLRYGRLASFKTVDVDESKARLRDYAMGQIRTRLRKLAGERKGQLAFDEVQGVVSDVFKEIRDLPKDDDTSQDLFPGINGAPSVDRSG